MQLVAVTVMDWETGETIVDLSYGPANPGEVSEMLRRIAHKLDPASPLVKLTDKGRRKVAASSR